MQERVPAHTRYAADVPQGLGDSGSLSSNDIKRFLLRYVRMISALTIMGALSAAIYAWTATPIFGARAQILIESRLPQALREQLGEAGAALDSPAIESQIALLRSGKIISDVIEKLDLDRDPEFGSAASEKVRWTVLIPWSRPATPETIEQSSSVQRELTLAALQNNIDIRRYGLSYVLDVGANSRDPEKAAKIVNAITDAFMADQMNLKIDAARQASDWREEQIGRLRTQMNRASRAVQEYKARRDYRLPPKTDDQVGTEPGALSGQVDSGKEQPGTRREAVTLEELEVSAQAYRKIYESNLQAHADAVLRQSLQFTNARVITTAAVPRNPTFPRPRILIAIGALAGAMLGLGISLVRHSIDNTIWTPDDIERAEAIQNLSTLPPVPVQNALLSRVMSGHATKLPQTIPMPVLHFTPFIARSTYGQSVRDAISVLGRLQREKKFVTIGITGIGGAAARSIVAGSLASAAVQSGRSAVIVDCDLDRRMLTNALTPGACCGLLEVMAGQCTLDQAVVTSVGETADVLPACSVDNEPSGSLAKNAANLKPVLDALAAKYHLVIVDLPNAADERADVLAAAPMVDAVICVIECGVATTAKLGLVMKNLRSVGVQPLGALLYACDEANG